MKRVALILVCVLIPGLVFAGSLDNAKKAFQEEKQEDYERAIKAQLMEIEKAKERVRRAEDVLDDILDKGVDQWWLDRHSAKDKGDLSISANTISLDYGTNTTIWAR